MKLLNVKNTWIAVALACALLAGCTTGVSDASGEDAMAAIEAEIRPVVEEADPETAIAEIYDSLAEYSMERLRDDEVEELTGIDTYSVHEYYVCYSNPQSKLADVIIVRPRTSNRDEVRNQLLMYKQRRIDEFENYDILRAHSIAEEAEIYDQGEYLILLMLEDNESARAIIDDYFPQ